MLTKLTNDQALAAVLAAKEIPESEKSVFAIISNNGPISSIDVEAATGIRSAHKVLFRLKQRGLVTSSDGPRAKNRKKVQVWAITGKMPDKLFKLKRYKYSEIPTAHQIKTAAKQLSIFLGTARAEGSRITVELQRVHRWLLAGAPSKTDNKAQDK